MKTILYIILITTCLLMPATAITPTISPALLAYEKAVFMNDYGLWKDVSMLPQIEIATSDPKFLPAFLLKAKVYNQLGNSSIAIQAAQHVVSQDPRNSAAWLEMGKAYSTWASTQNHSPFTKDLAAANYSLAIGALQNATVSDPGNEQAWLELASVYTATGNETAARDAYLEAMRINPYGAIANVGIR